MTPQPESELKGDLRTTPLAELLVEVSKVRLSGSLRISKGERKAIIYLKNGTVLYAVSNAREHRLFSLLLLQKKVGADVLRKFANPANDHELASWLKDEEILPAADVNFTIIRQIETVISDGLNWQIGEWVFDPLTRARDGMKVAVDVFKLVMEYGRGMPEELVSRRFGLATEKFTPAPERESKVNLDPHEKYLLERFGGAPLSMEQVREGCPIPAADMMRSLYVLWLAGLLVREGWTSTFSDSSLDALKNKRYTLTAKQEASAEAKPVDISIFADKRTAAERNANKSNEPAVASDLSTFLERVEKASNLYETLGVAKSASADQIKKAYLVNAQLFHPDKFHRETPDKQKRLHHAFSEIAKAHEALKTESARAAYDLKLRKEMEADKAPKIAAGENETEAGVENFSLGMAALTDENYAEASSHFSRAVHVNPQSARFHAYFGQALSAAEQYQHKAEGEFQTAMKLAPGNVEIRMMYIDFLIELDMLKRAEGELNRFLEIVPGSKEATERLAKLAR